MINYITPVYSSILEYTVGSLHVIAYYNIYLLFLSSLNAAADKSNFEVLIGQ